MKLLFILFALFITFITLASREIEITPFSQDFLGFEKKADTMIAYGNMGYYIYSWNNGKNWKKQKIFAEEAIVDLFFHNDKMISFSDSGKIAISDIRANKWDSILDLKELIHTVFEYSNGYLVRTLNRIIVIDKSLSIKYSIDFDSPVLKGFGGNVNYKNSMAIFNNHFIVETDSSMQIRFDSELNVIDTLSYFNLGLCDNKYSNFELGADSIYLYSIVNESLYRTKDFKTVEKIINMKSGFFRDLIIQNAKIFYTEYGVGSVPIQAKLFEVFDIDSTKLISGIWINQNSTGISLKESKIMGDEIYFWGLSNILFSHNLTDNSSIIYSNSDNIVRENAPEKNNDSTFIFMNDSYSNTVYSNGYSYFAWIYHPQVYHSIDEGITFQAVVDTMQHKDIGRECQIYFKFYDKNKQILYFAGEDQKLQYFLYTSKDFGKTFSKIPYPESYIANLSTITNVYHNETNNTIVMSPIWSVVYIDGRNVNGTHILTIDSEFKLMNRYSDTTMKVHYVQSNDTNSFLVYCTDFADSVMKVKYTSNRGKDWNVIKTYKNSESMIYTKEINYKNKLHLGVFYFRPEELRVNLDLLDIEGKNLQEIYSYKLDSLFNNNVLHNSLESDADTLYFSFEDTLIIANDLTDRSNWEKVNLPKNHFINMGLKKFGDKFWIHYGYNKYKYERNCGWLELKPEKEKPQPVISAQEYNFGIIDIKDTSKVFQKIKINNLSNDADLLIHSFSSLSESGFANEFVWNDTLENIKIEPQSYFELPISFKPTEVRKYKDSIIIFSNATQQDSIIVLEGEGIDTTTSVMDYLIENDNYLYAYPPYPLPAKNSVKSLIYWDTSIDIETDEINIYDIYGNKVSGREKISIDKHNNYSGILTWDCSDETTGIYLIHIKHGTRQWTLKTVVLK